MSLLAPFAGQGTRAGLWGLALVSAALPPICMAVAFAHRAQWPVGDAEPWGGFIVPLTWRAWGLVMALLLAGFAAGVRPLDPRAGTRVLGALARTGAGLAVALAAALPGAVWTVRLGAAPAGAVAVGLARAALGAAAGGLGGALAGCRLPFVPSALFGIAAGLGVLWAEP